MTFRRRLGRRRLGTGSVVAVCLWHNGRRRLRLPQRHDGEDTLALGTGSLAPDEKARHLGTITAVRTGDRNFLHHVLRQVR